MKPYLKLLPLLPLPVMLIIGTTLSAEAEEKKPLPPDLLQQMLAARVGCDSADDKMRANLGKVSHQFVRRCRALGRFPQTDEELALFHKELDPLVVANPYCSNATLAQQMAAQFPSSKAQLSISVDQFLNQNNIRQMVDHPPKDLSGIPGSIKVIHNDYDTFVVVGIGIDGKPVPVSTSNGKTLIVEQHPFVDD